MQQVITGRALKLTVKGSDGLGEYRVEDNDLGRLVTLTLGIDFAQCESDEQYLVAQALRAIADDIDPTIEMEATLAAAWKIARAAVANGGLEGKS
jgi:hypothetical protein